MFSIDFWFGENWGFGFTVCIHERSALEMDWGTEHEFLTDFAWEIKLFGKRWGTGSG